MAGQIVLQVFLLLIGFVLLVKGADFFVDGAAGIAGKLKVSTFIIGLTVVALGTSAPEAAVSVIGGIKASMGDGDAAKVIMGNVLGSNMMNILLILGISSLIAVVPVEKSSRYIELPFLIAMSFLFIILGDIGDSYVWYDGLILLFFYAAFMAYTIIMAKRSKPALIEEATATAMPAEGAAPPRTGFKGFMDRLSEKYEYLKGKVWFLIILTLVGLGMVVGGAQLVVDSATFIARDALQIDEAIVALTVVAFGTSLPELVTSVSAAKKGDMGLATGNIIGSNIANLLFVAGLGFVSSGGAVIPFDSGCLADGYMSIVAAALLLGFSFFKKNNLTKIAGVTLLSVLVGYYTYRILGAVGVVGLIEIPTLF